MPTHIVNIEPSTRIRPSRIFLKIRPVQKISFPPRPPKDLFLLSQLFPSGRHGISIAYFSDGTTGK